MKKRLRHPTKCCIHSHILKLRRKSNITYKHYARIYLAARSRSNRLHICAPSTRSRTLVTLYFIIFALICCCFQFAPTLTLISSNQQLLTGSTQSTVNNVATVVVGIGTCAKDTKCLNAHTYIHTLTHTHITADLLVLVTMKSNTFLNTYYVNVCVCVIIFKLRCVLLLLPHAINPFQFVVEKPN